MTNTEVSGSEGDAWSTAPDLAKLGQMLLNKGAYGNLRFFSEESYEKMVPPRTSSVAKPESGQLAWGIGPRRFIRMRWAARLLGTAQCRTRSCASIRSTTWWS